MKNRPPARRALVDRSTQSGPTGGGIHWRQVDVFGPVKSSVWAGSLSGLHLIGPSPSFKRGLPKVRGGGCCRVLAPMPGFRSGPRTGRRGPAFFSWPPLCQPSRDAAVPSRAMGVIPPDDEHHVEDTRGRAAACKRGPEGAGQLAEFQPMGFCGLGQRRLQRVAGPASILQVRQSIPLSIPRDTASRWAAAFSSGSMGREANANWAFSSRSGRDLARSLRQYIAVDTRSCCTCERGGWPVRAR